MIETCRDCALFFIYPSPKYDMGICEETRFIMAPEAPACNYYLPCKWTQKETTDGDKGTCQNHIRRMTMDDSISRQAAIETIMSGMVDINDSHFENASECNGFLLWARDEVMKLPSVDTVEAVRCKDCECYDLKNYYCTYLDNSNGPDGFCNFGERKADG